MMIKDIAEALTSYLLEEITEEDIKEMKTEKEVIIIEIKDILRDEIIVKIGKKLTIVIEGVIDRREMRLLLRLRRKL